MTTATASQAARIAEHLDAASEKALDSWVCVRDVRELLASPDGEVVPAVEALALVGRAAYARRYAEWVLEELASIEKGLMDEVDISRESSNA
jgi:hypothetical protein